MYVFVVARLVAVSRDNSFKFKLKKKVLTPPYLLSKLTPARPKSALPLPALPCPSLKGRLLSFQLDAFLLQLLGNPAQN